MKTAKFTEVNGEDSPMSERSLSAGGYRAPAVSRAFALLQTIAGSRRGMTLSQLARHLGHSKSTVHGLIQALIRVGALSQDPSGRRCFLGPGLTELVMAGGGFLRLAGRAQPLLDNLRDRLGWHEATADNVV